MAEIKCMPLRKVTDGPLFGSGPGVLPSLVNMELDPDGYVEARGGMEELKPNGGTAADAISAGGYSAIHQVTSSYGWIRTFDSAAGAGSQYSANRQFHEGGWLAFPTGVVNDAVYFGADSMFSRISASIAIPGSANTVTYEYWNGASWGSLTTAETISWTVLRTQQFASWTLPTDWATTTVGDAGTGNVLKYWMRIRVTTNLTSPRVGFAVGFWDGMREIYASTQSPRTSATSGTLKRHGQTGTTEEWFSVNTALFSANASPTRMASYRGRLVLINGKDTKRWDGANFKDLGIAVFAETPTLTAIAGGVLGAGVWRYYAAWGEGPCMNAAVYSDRQDAQALYGPGQAVSLGQVTTVGGQRVRVEIAVGTIPTGTSSLYLYRTDDLTNVDAAERPNMPAFLIQSFRILQPDILEDNIFTAATGYIDDSLAKVFPPQEAKVYDVSPPSRCKYVAIYQNRLFLGDDQTIFWSDPFQIDAYSTKTTTGFIRLARATGGRHMGFREFADQLVAWTEDQTWGITNVDLDVPQLFPIHPAVGSVAPDAAADGDGELIWMGRDGFYSWFGGRDGPKKISDSQEQTFGLLSYENHGGSRATVHNRRYDVRLASPGYVTEGNAYRFSLRGRNWNTITLAGFSSTLYPFGSIHAPLGNNDAGVLHSIWGKSSYATGAGEYGLFLGELTTQDAGSNYSCSATMHFPVDPDGVFQPYRVKGYYQASDGWGTPSFSIASTTPIGSSLGTLNTGTPDTGTDYSLIGATFSQTSRGTSDIVLTFSVTSAAGGTVNRQRFFGAIVNGNMAKMRRGMI